MNEKVKRYFSEAEKKLPAARAYLENKKYLLMGASCCSAAENALKAAYIHKTGGVPPTVHSHQLLSTRYKPLLDLSREQLILLDKLYIGNIEYRAIEYNMDNTAKYMQECYFNELLNETETFLSWIKERLEK